MPTNVVLPPPGPSPNPQINLPPNGGGGGGGGGGGLNVTVNGPPGGPQSTHANEPSIIPLPGGGILALPQRPLTPEERMVLGGVRAGNPVGGPAAQAVLDNLIAQGIVTPGTDPTTAPVYAFQAQTPPPGGGPLPGNNMPVYTQNRVTQEQNNQAFANGYQGMSAAQRWARYNQAQNPAPPANDPAPAPVEPMPAPSTPYVPPPTWGGPAGGGQQNADEINANQGPRPPQDGGSPPFYPGPPGQSLPGPKGGSPPFYPGPQAGGPGGPRPRGPVKPQQKPPGSPPFNSNPQATHANTLRTFLG